ncbi:MAG: LysM peptidoglycan-binding domain-containing protein, partial [Elusimicrobiota bacterium]|nr:LysM peptidoglycan-binding domain-containing protein [Elusimicrobiota bacterium]
SLINLEMKNKRMIKDIYIALAYGKKLRSFVFPLFLFCTLSPLPSPLSPTLYAADFTYIQPGIRANSIGGAFSAVADDPYALFYNPAGISTLTELQISGEISRRFAADSPIGEMAAVYVRPQPDRENDVAILGLHSLRHGQDEKKDSITIGYSTVDTMKYFQKPIRWGGNFKILRLAADGKNNLGIGFDAGVLLESDIGLKTALTLYDFNIGISKSMMTLTLGNSYRYKNTLFALDLKTRGGYSEFFAGIEHTIMNGLLQLRAGKGLALKGVDYLAYGLGINVLPFTIDVIASIPWEGMHEKGGQYALGVTYKFGGETFSESLVGNASNRLESMKRQIEGLRIRRIDLQTDIASYQVNKSIMQSDVVMMESRKRDLEKRLHNLEVDIENAQYITGEPKPKKKRRIKKRKIKWPRHYKVRHGDTLRSIASKFYGNPSLWETIYNANEKYISRGLPKTGKTFTIPPPPRKR